MGKCFVIQPFDRNGFDKRYDDILVPAIEGAGLEAYRVDRDPEVSIPIEDIELGIKSSKVCLADISLNRPNIWYEVGYALASKKEVVLICSSDRKGKFPFDIQHRNILQYKTDSPTDFKELGTQITKRLKAAVRKSEQMSQLASLGSVSKSEGMTPHEVAALVSIAQRIDEPKAKISSNIMRSDMENAGFAAIAATLAVHLLLEKGMIECSTATDYDGDEVTCYNVTENGMRWLVEHQDDLELRYVPPARSADDDLPF